MWFSLWHVYFKQRPSPKCFKFGQCPRDALSFKLRHFDCDDGHLIFNFYCMLNLISALCLMYCMEYPTWFLTGCLAYCMERSTCFLPGCLIYCMDYSTCFLPGCLLYCMEYSTCFLSGYLAYFMKRSTWTFPGCPTRCRSPVLPTNLRRSILFLSIQRESRAYATSRRSTPCQQTTTGWCDCMH